MPFDEEPEEIEQTSKKGLRKVSSQKSIFDDQPKKPSQEDFENKVRRVQDKSTGYKKVAAEYSVQFKKMISDRTLLQNKSIFASETESELISNMIKLAVEINTDPNEQEGMGSLMWIVLLLKTCVSQRDRINKLEYSVSQLEKKLESYQENKKGLDTPQNRE